MLRFAADPANLLSGLRWSPSYQAYTVRNFRQIPQIQSLSSEQQFAIEVVGQVLPFKANNYVVDELIDWRASPTIRSSCSPFRRRRCLRRSTSTRSPPC